jgi:hypothetical protein
LGFDIFKDSPYCPFHNLFLGDTKQIATKLLDKVVSLKQWFSVDGRRCAVQDKAAVMKLIDARVAQYKKHAKVVKYLQICS